MDLSLILIPAAAVLAPLFARGLGRWVRIPVVVFELLLGILIGPSLLGWVGPSEFVDGLSEMGLAMLFFVAGTEIQLSILRSREGGRAIGGWLVSLAVGIAVGFVFAPGEAAIVIGIALASTAIGTLLPMLRDADELQTPFGRSILAVGAVGEFGPLVAISVFLGSRDIGAATVVLAIFLVIAAVAVLLAFTLPHGALHEFVESTLHTSGQYAVRVILLILGSLTVLSIALDLDMLLGAFAAGIVWSLMMRDASEESREAVESKVEALAFGFLVPIFFIYTGVTFDLQTLLDDPALWGAVVGATIVLLLVRGIPSAFAAPKGSSRLELASIGLFGATGLPIIVAVTAIGTDAGVLPPAVAPVLVAAGMLSVLIFPVVGFALRGDAISRQKRFMPEAS